MGDIDISSKEYFRDPFIFADVFNFWLHDGAQIIKPEQLQEVSESLISFSENPLHPNASPTKKGKGSEQTRDALKHLVCMEDGQSVYAILGIEGQTKVDYSMVARALIYDSRQFEKQIREIRALNERLKEKTLDDAENSWWFYKSDRLIPVITIIVYLGESECGGPRALQDLYSSNDPLILKHSVQYKMNLIEPYRLSSEDLSKFHTDLRTVMSIIKAASDRNIFNKIREDKLNQSLGDNARRLLFDLSGLKLKHSNVKEVNSMWKGIQLLCEDSQQEGFLDGLIFSVRSLMQSLNCSQDDALNILNISCEYRPAILKQLETNTSK